MILCEYYIYCGTRSVETDACKLVVEFFGLYFKEVEMQCWRVRIINHAMGLQTLPKAFNCGRFIALNVSGYQQIIGSECRKFEHTNQILYSLCNQYGV